mgnify:CR=1 FL=1
MHIQDQRFDIEKQNQMLSDYIAEEDEHILEYEMKSAEFEYEEVK